VDLQFFGIIDENIWLACREMIISEQPGGVVKVVQYLSDTSVSITVRGEPKPTPAWWIERFTECGVNVAWRILGDAAVPAERVPKDDYTGWFLQEVDAIESTRHGLLVSFSHDTSTSFHASFEWHQNEVSPARICSALAQIVAGFKDCEVQCGNCKLTGSQWQKAVLKGQQYLATLYPGLSQALRQPVSLICLLCNSEFVASSNGNDFYAGYYCEPCRENRSHLFVLETSKPNAIRYDFEASIRFLTTDEGGRQSKYVAQQLYRSDFRYKDFSDDLFMIWPTFLSSDGIPIERGEWVDTSKTLNAFMTIIDDKLRVSLHQKRLAQGIDFYLCEGGRVVAEGKVLRILDLFSS
jgi:hypothetical protein